MGCVGSKKEQEALSKGMGKEELHSRAHTAHYVKDPTTGNSGSKLVSSNLTNCEVSWYSSYHKQHIDKSWV